MVVKTGLASSGYCSTSTVRQSKFACLAICSDLQPQEYFNSPDFLTSPSISAFLTTLHSDTYPSFPPRPPHCFPSWPLLGIQALGKNVVLGCMWQAELRGPVGEDTGEWDGKVWYSLPPDKLGEVAPDPKQSWRLFRRHYLGWQQNWRKWSDEDLIYCAHCSCVGRASGNLACGLQQWTQHQQNWPTGHLLTPDPAFLQSLMKDQHFSTWGRGKNRQRSTRWPNCSGGKIGRWQGIWSAGECDKAEEERGPS